MFKSEHCSFVRTHARTTVRLLRAAARRPVPVIEDAAVPAASVPPREPAAKQSQPPRAADDEREKAEARRLKLREKYRADDDNKHDKLAVVVTPLGSTPAMSSFCSSMRTCRGACRGWASGCARPMRPSPFDPQGLPCPL
ncbi:uncharacterized protein LOC144167052 [Haemaphysalis longicornis]